MICMLHLMKLSSHVRWLIFCSVLNVLVPPSPSPLELIQLPAKKHSLTTYKEKKNLIAGRQPGFSPTHGCISVFARVSSNLFLLPQSLMPNVQLSKRVNSLFSTWQSHG